jgi:hypothetical protein
METWISLYMGFEVVGAVLTLVMLLLYMVMRKISHLRRKSKFKNL